MTKQPISHKKKIFYTVGLLLSNIIFGVLFGLVIITFPWNMVALGDMMSSYSGSMWSLKAIPIWSVLITGFALTIGYLISIIFGWVFYSYRYFKTGLLFAWLPLWILGVGFLVHTFGNKVAPDMLNNRAIAQFKKTLQCTGCAIRNVDLSHGQYQNSDLRADFTNVNLSHSDFRHSKFIGFNLQRSNLSYSDVSNSEINSSLIGNNLDHMVAKNCLFQQSNLIGNMRYADFSHSKFNNSSFVDADLRGAKFYNASFIWTDFIAANMKGVNLRNLNFKNSSFYRANLENADLRGSSLKDTELGLANLLNAKVNLRQLSEAKSLCGAILPDGSKGKCEQKERR